MIAYIDDSSSCIAILISLPVGGLAHDAAGRLQERAKDLLLCQARRDLGIFDEALNGFRRSRNDGKRNGAISGSGHTKSKARHLKQVPGTVRMWTGEGVVEKKQE